MDDARPVSQVKKPSWILGDVLITQQDQGWTYEYKIKTSTATAEESLLTIRFSNQLPASQQETQQKIHFKQLEVVRRTAQTLPLKEFKKAFTLNRRLNFLSGEIEDKEDLPTNLILLFEKEEINGEDFYYAKGMKHDLKSPAKAEAEGDKEKKAGIVLSLKKKQKKLLDRCGTIWKHWEDHYAQKLPGYFRQASVEGIDLNLPAKPVKISRPPALIHDLKKQLPKFTLLKDPQDPDLDLIFKEAFTALCDNPLVIAEHISEIEQAMRSLKQLQIWWKSGRLEAEQRYLEVLHGATRKAIFYREGETKERVPLLKQFALARKELFHQYINILFQLEHQTAPLFTRLQMITAESYKLGQHLAESSEQGYTSIKTLNRFLEKLKEITKSVHNTYFHLASNEKSIQKSFEGIGKSPSYRKLYDWIFQHSLHFQTRASIIFPPNLLEDQPFTLTRKKIDEIVKAFQKNGEFYLQKMASLIAIQNDLQAKLERIEYTKQLHLFLKPKIKEYFQAHIAAAKKGGETGIQMLNELIDDLKSSSPLAISIDLGRVLDNWQRLFFLQENMRKKYPLLCTILRDHLLDDIKELVLEHIAEVKMAIWVAKCKEAILRQVGSYPPDARSMEALKIVLEFQELLVKHGDPQLSPTLFLEHFDQAKIKKLLESLISVDQGRSFFSI